MACIDAVLCVVAVLPWIMPACCHTACIMLQIGLSLVHLIDTYAGQMSISLPAAFNNCWASLLCLLLLQIDITGQRITPEEDVGLYGRSVTFVPASPALPAPFR